MPLRRRFALALTLLLAATAARANEPIPRPSVVEEFPKELLTKAPANAAELRLLQKRVQEVARKVAPYTVGIQAGQGSGSGVIVSADGYVLTAGHVSGEANRDVTLILHDGRRVKAKTLGANNGIDSGMI